MIEPKLRFKADDGSQFLDWEEKTLGDIGTAKMCKRVLKEQTSEKGDVPFYKIGTFGGTPDAFISRELYEELKAKYDDATLDKMMKDEVKRLSQRLTPYKRPININVLKQALPRTKKATVQRNKVKELIQA